MSPEELLDNLVWHALAGPHAAMAIRTPGAARYPTDVDPFGALADPSDPEGWSGPLTLLGPGGQGAVFRDAATLPTGWTGDGVRGRGGTERRRWDRGADS